MDLISRFNLTYDQAQAILDMRLQRLTGLERDKIEAEYAELQKKIAEFRAILADEQLVLQIISEELEDVKVRFGDERRTELMASDEEILDEDLIPREDVVISVTHSGYVKRLACYNLSQPEARRKRCNRNGYEGQRFCRASFRI